MIWVEDCKLPPIAFSKVLKQMSEPTSSKWQVMFDICYALLPLLDPLPQYEGSPFDQSGLSQLEVFFSKLLTLLPGSMDSTKATRVTHAHIDKIQVFSGLLAEMDLFALIYLTVDFWEGNCQAPAPPLAPSLVLYSPLSSLLPPCIPLLYCIYTTTGN